MSHLNAVAVQKPITISEANLEKFEELTPEQIKLLKMGQQRREAEEREAEEQRRQDAAQAEAQCHPETVEEELDYRELCARTLDKIEGLEEVAAALRGLDLNGNYLPPKKGAEILIESLWDKRVPNRFKVKPDGAIRQVIELAKTAQRYERTEAWEVADSLFAELLDMLASLEELCASSKGSTYSAEVCLQQIDGIVSRFFPKDGSPMPIKALESMITANDGNRISQLISDDREITETVNFADPGKRAGALLNVLRQRANSMVENAKAQASADREAQRAAREAQWIRQQNKSSGFTGRRTGKTDRERGKKRK